MADKKISDLNALTAAAAGDLLIISDTSASETKKITFAQIKKDIGITEGANVFTVSAANGTNFTFADYNGNGSNANDPSLYLLEDHTYVFDLTYASASHPFAIRTGGASGSAGTNLVTGNGGDRLIHIATDGTVTTGATANAKYSGLLIWRIPHFGVKQTASTGDYHYQCTAHAGMFGQIFIGSVFQGLDGTW